ncbi:MAG TPA: ABC transporter substrate-binding protein [Alphaproteobacteria bacterium]|nr:ABC transporter substrate-binding protein [Alphaproteobacteria bacterium]
MKRRESLRAGLAIIALPVLALAGTSAFAQQPIKIGAPLAVTGPASFLGDPEAKTLRLYVDRINKAGGVLGRPIQVIIYDTGGDARQAVTFARRLIEEDKVDGIVGGTTTGETMAMVPLVEEAQLPFISLAGASVIVEPVKKWVFKMPHSDRMAVQKIYGDLKKRGIANVAVIAGSGGFDQSCRKEAATEAPKFGIKVVADETYAATDTDMTPQLTKIRGTSGVQAIVGCGFGAPTSLTVRNWKQLGMTNIPFYFNHGVAAKQFITGAQGAAEGVRLPAAALLVADQLPEGDRQRAVSLGYARAYKEAFNEDVSTFGGHAFDGLHLYVDAIKRANSVDKAKVRDAIEQTKDFVGTDGIYNMTPADHLGLTLDSFKLVEIRNNDWNLVE